MAEVSPGVTVSPGKSAPVLVASETDALLWNNLDGLFGDVARPKLHKHYLFGRVVGEGSYSKVKEVLDVWTMERKAVKIMCWRQLRKIPKGEENARNEMRLITRLKHPNIVTFYETIHRQDKAKWYTIMEWCCCSLQDLVVQLKGAPMPLFQAQKYFRHLTAGLDYLQSQRVAHKDIKPGNLLINIEDVLKITDFGVAEDYSIFTDSDSTQVSQGSPVFQPPEVANSCPLMSGFKIDIWSAGVTLFNLVTGTLPFRGDTILQMLDSIAKAEFAIPQFVTDDNLRQLINGMMHADFKQRFDVNQVKSSIWFKTTIQPSCNCSRQAVAPTADPAYDNTSLSGSSESSPAYLCPGDGSCTAVGPVHHHCTVHTFMPYLKALDVNSEHADDAQADDAQADDVHYQPQLVGYPLSDMYPSLEDAPVAMLNHCYGVDDAADDRDRADGGRADDALDDHDDHDHGVWVLRAGQQNQSDVGLGRRLDATKTSNPEWRRAASSDQQRTADNTEGGPSSSRCKKKSKSRLKNACKIS